MITLLITIALLAGIFGYFKFSMSNDYHKARNNYIDKSIPKWALFLCIIGVGVYFVTNILNKFELAGLIVGIVCAAPMLLMYRVSKKEFDDQHTISPAQAFTNDSSNLDSKARNIKTLDQFKDYLNTENGVNESVIKAVISNNGWLDRTDEEDMICSDSNSYLSFDRYEGCYGVHLMG